LAFSIPPKTEEYQNTRVVRASPRIRRYPEILYKLLVGVNEGEAVTDFEGRIRLSYPEVYGQFSESLGAVKERHAFLSYKRRRYLGVFPILSSQDYEQGVVSFSPSVASFRTSEKKVEDCFHIVELGIFTHIPQFFGTIYFPYTFTRIIGDEQVVLRLQERSDNRWSLDFVHRSSDGVRNIPSSEIIQSTCRALRLTLNHKLGDVESYSSLFVDWALFFGYLKGSPRANNFKIDEQKVRGIMTELEFDKDRLDTYITRLLET